MENALRNIQTPAEDVNKDSKFVVSVTIYIPGFCFVFLRYTPILSRVTPLPQEIWRGC